MVIVFDAQVAETPAGRLVGVPIPVAPVVAMVMGVKAVLIQRVGFDEGLPAVLFGLTVTVVVPAALVQPLTVAVTLYVPAIAVVAEELTVGFWLVEVKPLGPVQE